MLSDLECYKLQFPSDFEDYAWEVEYKGWFNDVILEFKGKSYKLKFYDPVRLAQYIDDELKSNSLFYEENLLVVKLVTRVNIENAVKLLIESDRISELHGNNP